jgi:hypothetical protein
LNFKRNPPADDRRRDHEDKLYPFPSQKVKIDHSRALFRNSISLPHQPFGEMFQLNLVLKKRFQNGFGLPAQCRRTVRGRGAGAPSFTTRSDSNQAIRR